MSNQRQSNRYGTGTVSGNVSRAGASGPTVPGPFQKGYGSGLVSLGTAKKPRTASTLDKKLSVPRPVNLPSLRKENAGNDPNTQLVPTGGPGGWQKPDAKEEPEEEFVPNLTAGSSWASAPSTSGVPSWQPPQPFPVAVSGPTKARNLNPLEYPSLSAAAVAQKQSGTTIQPVQHLPSSGSQGANWDEDERKPAFGHTKLAGESWADSTVEEEVRSVYRPPWEQNGRNRADDHWSSRSRPGYGSRALDRFKEVDDPHLFPPPPPPRQPPPPPPRAGDVSREDADAEKRAFEAEIDRVIEEERRRERDAAAAAQEAARAQALEEEEAAALAAIDSLSSSMAAPIKSSGDSEFTPPSATEQQAAVEAARQKAIAARKRRETEDAEIERRRKEAANAKLKELEERMNARKRELEEARAAEAADVSASAALGELSAAVEETLETSAGAAAAMGQAAVAKEMQITRLIEHEPSGPTQEPPGGRQGGIASSLEADAGSIVSLTEKLDGFRDASTGVSESDSLQDSRAASEASWAGRPAAAIQPQAIWQHRKQAPADAAAPSPKPVQLTDNLHGKEVQPTSKEQSGAASLFASNSNFGPSLVATSLGISAEDLVSVQQKSSKSPVTSDKQTAPTTVPSGPLNWRAVMGVKEPEEPKSAKLEEVIGSKPEGPGASRGRGRGRRDRDRSSRDESSDPGGRSRGGRERGRGRGRGRVRHGDQASKEEPSVVLSGDPIDVIGDHQPAASEVRRGPRASRGRGDRGRGRGAAASQAVPPPPPPPPPPPLSARTPRAMDGISTDDLPPGIFPQVKRHVKDMTPSLNGPTDNLTWPTDVAASDALTSFTDLAIGQPKGLSPSHDWDSKGHKPLAPINSESRNDRAFDRPIDRPKSAVGPVGQPISKSEPLLSNGIPNLPSDLSVESLGGGNKPQQSGPISFGFQPSQPSLAPGSDSPFPGLFFHGQQQKDPWQQRPPEHQPNLEAAVQSFYKAGGSSPREQQAGGGGLQFGAFGAQSFPQFGQLGSSFGQAPFIHTGKQPDWSTGPALGNNAHQPPKQHDGLGQSQSQSSGPEFARSVGMDAIVQPSSLSKRGPQSAPGHQGPAGPSGGSLGPPPTATPQGPPGLQRSLHPQESAPPQSLLPGDLYTHDHASKSPPPPPGLQNPTPLQQQPFYYGGSRTPRSLPQGPYSGGSQVNVSFSGPQQTLRSMGHLPFQQSGFPEQSQPQYSQGPPPGAMNPGLLSRDQVLRFPDDVFDSSTATPNPEQEYSSGQFQPMTNSIQGGRRGSMDGRVRVGRGPSRAPATGRGRGYGRPPNTQGGRGSAPAQHLGVLGTQGFPQVQMSGVGPGFPIQQGGLGGMAPLGGFPAAPSEQAGNNKRGPHSKSRGRTSTRGSQDSNMMAGSYGDR